MYAVPINGTSLQAPNHFLSSYQSNRPLQLIRYSHTTPYRNQFCNKGFLPLKECRAHRVGLSKNPMHIMWGYIKQSTLDLIFFSTQTDYFSRLISFNLYLSIAIIQQSKQIRCGSKRVSCKQCCWSGSVTAHKCKPSPRCIQALQKTRGPESSERACRCRQSRPTGRPYIDRCMINFFMAIKSRLVKLGICWEFHIHNTLLSDNWQKDKVTNLKHKNRKTTTTNKQLGYLQNAEKRIVLNNQYATHLRLFVHATNKSFI